MGMIRNIIAGKWKTTNLEESAVIAELRLYAFCGSEGDSDRRKRALRDEYLPRVLPWLHLL
jgi:hypothetical protein